jgi:hypothetical protein
MEEEKFTQEDPIIPPDPIMPADEAMFWSASDATDSKSQMFKAKSADFGEYNNYLEVNSEKLNLRVAQHYRYNKTYVDSIAVGYGGAGVTYWTGSYQDTVPTLEFNVIGSIYN